MNTTTRSLRIGFAGTPAFAATALRSIAAAGFQIVGVLTQPDRAAGRGLQAQPSAVKREALERGWIVDQPSTLRASRKDGTPLPEGSTAQQRLREWRLDVLVVAAYGLILPPEVLAIPRFGCLNIHASLLPRWRGAAPIHRAIEAGDTTTGVTIMQMDAGLDTGPMLLAEPATIHADDTTALLHDRLADLGGRLIVDALDRLPDLVPQPQPELGVTYAHKVEKHEAAIDFGAPAHRVAARIRAFNPTPGAYAELLAPTKAERTGEASADVAATPLKCWQAHAVSGDAAEAGLVLEANQNGIVVACGEGRVCITELQRPGGKRLGARDFLAGFAIKKGDRFKRC